MLRAWWIKYLSVCAFGFMSVYVRTSSISGSGLTRIVVKTFAKIVVLCWPLLNFKAAPIKKSIFSWEGQSNTSDPFPIFSPCRMDSPGLKVEWWEYSFIRYCTESDTSQLWSLPCLSHIVRSNASNSWSCANFFRITCTILI